MLIDAGALERLIADHTEQYCFLFGQEHENLLNQRL